MWEAGIKHCFQAVSSLAKSAQGEKKKNKKKNLCFDSNRHETADNLYATTTMAEVEIFGMHSLTSGERCFVSPRSSKLNAISMCCTRFTEEGAAIWTMLLCYKTFNCMQSEICVKYYMEKYVSVFLDRYPYFYLNTECEYFCHSWIFFGLKHADDYHFFFVLKLAYTVSNKLLQYGNMLNCSCSGKNNLWQYINVKLFSFLSQDSKKKKSTHFSLVAPLKWDWRWVVSIMQNFAALLST